MTPRDHRHDRETIASPEALVRDLCAQEGPLPEALRRQCVTAGAAMVPTLIALLETALGDDQDEPEGALCHAVDLLGTLGDTRAVPILLRCLEHDERGDGLALPAAAALRTLGPAALDACLAADAMTPHEAFRDRLAGVMSRCGVHDERLYACLVETLQRTPELGANALAEYGEARALDVLARTFDTLPLRDEESPLANHVFLELRAAMEDLGGQLTAAQHQKFEAADAARRRLVAQMHWDMDPPAAPSWRTPLRATSGAGTRPPRPAGTRKLGRNAPCWCGSGQTYQKCHLPLERCSGEHMDGLCSSARDYDAISAQHQGHRRGWPTNLWRHPAARWFNQDEHGTSGDGPRAMPPVRYWFSPKLTKSQAILASFGGSGVFVDYRHDLPSTFRVSTFGVVRGWL